MCTPFTYDSMAHGKNLGRQVVHSAGVKIATAAAAPTANTKLRVLLAAAAPNPDNQHNIPSKIIEMPRMFSTSTRNRSVHGEIGIPSTNSCTRKSIPSPNTSVPRHITCFAMAPRSTPLPRSFSVTKATATPAKKINRGAGRVPPICEYRKPSDFFASTFSHES